LGKESAFYGPGNTVSFFGLYAPEQGRLEEMITFTANYRKYYTKLTKLTTSYSQETRMLE
jgi:hypothetical protein